MLRNDYLIKSYSSCIQVECLFFQKESFLSVSSHNVGLPALEVRRPECSGYLQKVGNRHKTWRRRYCILKDACLYYYKSMNSLSALGKFFISCLSLLCTASKSMYPCSWCIFVAIAVG